MGDLRIVWDAKHYRGDLVMAGAGLAIGNDLETAVLLSLFTDRRADGDFVPPDGSDDRRGVWFEAFGTQAGDQKPWGSRLWQFARAVRTQATLNDIIDACREALQWLIDDGVATSIDVAGQFYGRSGVALGISVRQGNQPMNRFSYVWPMELAA